MLYAHVWRRLGCRFPMVVRKDLPCRNLKGERKRHKLKQLPRRKAPCRGGGGGDKIPKKVAPCPKCWIRRGSDHVNDHQGMVGFSEQPYICFVQIVVHATFLRGVHYQEDSLCCVRVRGAAICSVQTTPVFARVILASCSKISRSSVRK